MSNDIEALIDKYSINNEEDILGYKVKVFHFTEGGIKNFVAALSQPQEAVAWGVFNEVEKSFEFIANWREAGNEHINDMPISEISKMRLVPLYTAPPNYEAEIRTLRNQCVTLTEENERLREAISEASRKLLESATPYDKACTILNEALKKGE